MSNFIVNCTEDVVLVTVNRIPNNSHSIFDIFETLKNINVDMICQTAPYKDTIDLSFSIDQSDLPAVMQAVGTVKKQFADSRTEINPGNCKITIFSESLKTESGIAARLFSVLSANDLHIKLITTSDVEISLLMDQHDAMLANEIIRKEFN